MSTPENRFIDPLKRGISLADKGLSFLENATNLFAGTLVFALMFLGVAQIFMRTVLNKPIFGYIDIVEVSMVGFAVLSIAYVQRLGSHVRMELLVSTLKGRWLWFVEALGAGLTGFIVVVLIPPSYAHFQRAFEFGDSTIDIELVTWPAKLVVPIALTILLLRIAVQFMAYVRMLMNPHLDPIAIPVVKGTEERAEEEIRLARDA